MAIGRVSGSMLVSNLDRQGTDLQFTTNSQPLVYMNFSQFKLGVNTSTLSETLTINGNLSTTNILLTGSNIGVKSGTLQVNNPINLGDIGNVKITGGTANYIVATDGNGNLSFIDANVSPGIAAIEANIGAYQTWANANAASQATSINTINANIGAYETWANTSISTINSNIGSYQTWANANAASQTTSINTINANVSAANSAIATLQTQVYSNANVASYLTVFNGNVNAGNVNLSGNLHTDFISPNVNSVVTFTGTSAIKLPVGNDAQRPTGAIGEIRYSTQSGAPEYYNGTTWVPITNTVTDQIITGDGVNSVYTLDQVATNVGTLVSINGTLQQPGVAYNISGNQITFAEVMLSTDVIDIRYLGGVVSFNNQLNDDLTISGNLTVNGNVSYNNFYYGNILPQTTLVSNIGSTAKQFNTIFASNITVDNTATIGGNLTVNGIAGIIMPNRPAFRVFGNGGQIAATANATSSNFTVDYNQGSYLNTTTGYFTAPVAGLYQVNLITRASANNYNGAIQSVIQQNYSGGNKFVIMIEYNNNTSMNHTGGSTVVKMAVGDTLQFRVLVGTISFDGNDNWSVAYIG